MFPLSDSTKSKSFPIITLLLIAINLFVFYKELSAPNLDNFILQYALIPKNVNIFNFFSITPFVTSMFLHGGFIHIITNMWFLWVFGDNIEDKLGKIRFLALYFSAGIFGAILQYIMFTSSDIPTLGASGAISGILGAYFVLFPRSRVKTLIFIFFFVTIIEIPAVLYLFYWFFLQIFSGIASLNITSQTGGVAFWVHVGGFVTGVIFGRRTKLKSDQNYIEGEIVSE